MNKLLYTGNRQSHNYYASVRACASEVYGSVFVCVSVCLCRRPGPAQTTPSLPGAAHEELIYTHKLYSYTHTHTTHH